MMPYEKKLMRLGGHLANRKRGGFANRHIDFFGPLASGGSSILLVVVPGHNKQPSQQNSVRISSPYYRHNGLGITSKISTLSPFLPLDTRSHNRKKPKAPVSPD